MLNLNSPTVQMMLANTPLGTGNLPVYYGNTPTTTSEIVQVPSQSSIPFPSPKEMLMQEGMNNVYQQVEFATPPRNIVGAYNPGYQAAFANYSNPYMANNIGGGYYNGGLNYGFNPYFSQQPMFMDEETREMYEASILNGVTYQEQLETESKLFKKMSRIVSKYLDRNEEEAKKCEEKFNIYDKRVEQEQRNIYNPQRSTVLKKLCVRVEVDDKVIADSEVSKKAQRQQDYQRNTMYVEYMKARQTAIEFERVRVQNELHNRALERQFDKTDMLDYFNNHVGVVMADALQREAYMQSVRRAAQVYNRDDFKERLLKNNGIRSRSEMKAVERFAGRYGIMPDGRPVSPGHDPEVATSFSYDPKTGQYHVTAPNFIRDRLEKARESFIRSI